MSILHDAHLGTKFKIPFSCRKDDIGKNKENLQTRKNVFPQVKFGRNKWQCEEREEVWYFVSSTGLEIIIVLLPKAKSYFWINYTRYVY